MSRTVAGEPGPVADLPRKALAELLGSTPLAATVVGCCLGVVVADLMFALPAVELSITERGGAGVLLGEVVVATFGCCW